RVGRGDQAAPDRREQRQVADAAQGARLGGGIGGHGGVLVWGLQRRPQAQHRLRARLVGRGGLRRAQGRLGGAQRGQRAFERGGLGGQQALGVVAAQGRAGLRIPHLLRQRRAVGARRGGGRGAGQQFGQALAQQVQAHPAVLGPA